MGATGIGAPVQTNGSTSTSSNVLHMAAVPSYVAAGQTVIDLSPQQMDAIPPTLTVASKTGTTVTLTGGNVASTVNSGDVLAFFTSVDNASFPGCVSANAGTHTVTISGSNCTLPAATDYRPDGGWRIRVQAAGAIITNAYLETLSNLYDPIDCAGSGNDLTISGSTLNGDHTIDSDTNGLLFSTCGAIVSSYNVYQNGPTDDIDMTSTSPQTLTSSYDVFENNGSGSLSGSHPDWLQAYYGTLTVNFTRPVSIWNENGTWFTRGFGLGDYDTSQNLYSGSFYQPLIIVSAVLSGGGNPGVQQAFGVSSSAALAGNIVITQPYVDPTGINADEATPIADNGQPGALGGATCSFSGTTMTCSAGSPVSGNFINAAGITPGTKINSGTGPFTLNNNVGAIGSESVGLWSVTPNKTLVASGSGTTLTVTSGCAVLSTTNAYVMGLNIPAGTHAVSDTCAGGATGTITLNNNVGTFGSETIAVWYGANYASGFTFSATGGVNMITGGSCNTVCPP